MNNRVFYLLVVFAFMAALNSCNHLNNRDLDNPLVGVWEADVPGGPDYGYGATWRFNKDESYHLEFGSVSIAGLAQGYSYGTYDMISDSILVVHSTDHDNLVHNYAFTKEKDTLFVEVADSRLTSTAVRSVGPLQFEIAGDTIGWEKLIE